MTSSHPAALIHFLDQVPGRLPLLRPAFGKILWAVSGRSIGRKQFSESPFPLEHAAERAGSSAGEGDRVFMKTIFLGDKPLGWRQFAILALAASLAGPHCRILRWQTPLASNHDPRDGARLTPDGERILKTELKFVELNGIDDWVGGYISTRESGMSSRSRQKDCSGSFGLRPAEERKQ